MYHGVLLLYIYLEYYISTPHEEGTTAADFFSACTSLYMNYFRCCVSCVLAVYFLVTAVAANSLYMVHIYMYLLWNINSHTSDNGTLTFRGD